MSKEQRVLLAALLSTLCLVWYGQLVTKRTAKPLLSQQQPASPGASTQVAGQNSTKAGTLYHLVNETVTSMGPSDMRLEIGLQSGTIRSITRTIQDAIGTQTVAIGGELPLVRVRAAEAPLVFHLEHETTNSVTFSAGVSSQNDYIISYNIDEHNKLVNIELQCNNCEKSGEARHLILESSWLKGDSLSDRYNRLEILALHNEQGRKQAYKRFFAPLRTEVNVPRGTNLLSLADRYFCCAIKPRSGNLQTTLLPSPPGTVAAETVVSLSGAEAGANEYSATIYMGPRDYFYLKDTEFRSAFPVGILGKIGLILLWILKSMAGVTRNYGVAIILFGALVTCAMAPFTMLGFKSMKKMQTLKPELDKIMARHKDDQKRANQEIFALYKEHKVSPVSGCLPMVLQMPVFIALFGAISHFIELRGKPFLWIKDLSLPDRLAKLPLALPIIGQDLNALPLIMAVAMFAQTKLSQKNMPTSDPQTSAMMSGPLMSILFGVMFYQFPSGLVLYWLTNSLMSMAWYRFSK